MFSVDNTLQLSKTEIKSPRLLIELSQKFDALHFFFQILKSPVLDYNLRFFWKISTKSWLWKF